MGQCRYGMGDALVIPLFLLNVTVHTPFTANCACSTHQLPILLLAVHESDACILLSVALQKCLESHPNTAVCTLCRPIHHNLHRAVIVLQCAFLVY